MPEGQLIRIRPAEGDMIAVKMAEHDIRRPLQSLHDPLPHPFPRRYLARMGKKTVPHISQRHPGINDDPPAAGNNQTAQPADAKGFGADDFNGCMHGFSGAFLPRG
jgi:hypothetical protein